MSRRTWTWNKVLKKTRVCDKRNSIIIFHFNFGEFKGIRFVIVTEYFIPKRLHSDSDSWSIKEFSQALTETFLCTLVCGGSPSLQAKRRLFFFYVVFYSRSLSLRSKQTAPFHPNYFFILRQHKTSYLIYVLIKFLTCCRLIFPALRADCFSLFTQN